MTAPRQPKALLAVAFLLAAGGLVLAREAWVASPRLLVPHGIAYILTGVLLAAAIMVALQVFGVWRWNDLLAAALLLGVTVELLWLTFGAGPPRRCRWGWWEPPERVCRTMIGVAALACAAMTVWAAQRYVRRAPD
jgi:hypothetical protein